MVDEPGGGGLLTVEGGLVIWTLVVFGLLLYILKRSAWPVLLQAVREREQRLEGPLAEAPPGRGGAGPPLGEQKKAPGRALGGAPGILHKAKVVGGEEGGARVPQGREEGERLLAPG